MKELRWLARRFLNDAPLTTFWEIVNEAKITDEEREVLDMKFIHGKANVQIAMALNMSLEKVNQIIKKSYEKIAKLIL